MSMQGYPGAQSAVVMPPRGERPEPKRGTPRSIPTIARVEFFAVQVADEEGNIASHMMVEVGGKFFADPNGGHWISQLTEVKPWVQEQLQARVLKRSSETAPPEQLSPLKAGK